jgi:lysophospholipase L1-like esterase
MAKKRIHLSAILMVVIGMSISAGVAYGKTPKATPTLTPTSTASPAATSIPTATASSTSTVTKVEATIPVETVTSVYIAGDSTASIYAPNLAPRTGWGQILQGFFNEKQVTVKDQAVSGRSSKSFIDEGYLEAIAKTLKANDYLLIQFGHNDQKTEEARHTDPFTTYKACLTQYIKVAREKGAIPILLTRVNRYRFEAGQVVSTHGDYPKAVTELGKELNVPVIDITEKSRKLFDTLGPEKTFKLFMNLEPGESPNYPTGNKDNTHFTLTGATEIAKLVVEGLRELNLPLAKQLK